MFSERPWNLKIVIEGCISHSEIKLEGPFGEYPGMMKILVGGIGQIARGMNDQNLSD
jgi:hypothetical protein